MAYYDATRTGTLVSRIMNDVEGVRNLIGTGLLEFTGGIMTAVIAFAILIKINREMTLLTFCILLVFGAILQRCVQDDPPDLPRAGEDQRRGDGAADRVAGRGPRV